MRIESFDEYAARHGVGRSQFGEAGLHKRGHMSDAAHGRAVRAMMASDAKVSDERDRLRESYARDIADGLLRGPTRQERIVKTASGHPDLISVQAARRICKKNGWIFTCSCNV